jgi:ATP-dependent exoDNAse (exonuclease V) alpha subunit
LLRPPTHRLYVLDESSLASSKQVHEFANRSIRPHKHLDYCYAMTSHSSQGQTADRVLIYVDTELGAKDLLNSRMAYVAVSRGAHDAKLFTNDREKLPSALARDVSQ